MEQRSKTTCTACHVDTRYVHSPLATSVLVPEVAPAGEDHGQT